MRAYLRTFGCRANQYDTEAARAMIEAAGGVIVDTPDEADVALFNSCAVTSAAEADLRQAVRRAAKDNAGIRSVVIGCASARDDGTIAALPGVSDVIGGADLSALAMALGIDPVFASARAGTQTGSRALLRIQDGCDEHCTFCSTTLARGANRSRPADELVREAGALAAEHPEIVITGIHIGTYGVDRGSSLGALVERLVTEIQGYRSRLTWVAIPLSLIGAVFLMQVFGFTLNLLTLLAIVLAVGLVVDDAIVERSHVEADGAALVFGVVVFDGGRADRLAARRICARRGCDHGIPGRDGGGPRGNGARGSLPSAQARRHNV